MREQWSPLGVFCSISCIVQVHGAHHYRCTLGAHSPGPMGSSTAGQVTVSSRGIVRQSRAAQPRLAVLHGHFDVNTLQHAVPDQRSDDGVEGLDSVVWQVVMDDRPSNFPLAIISFSKWNLMTMSVKSVAQTASLQRSRRALSPAKLMRTAVFTSELRMNRISKRVYPRCDFGSCDLLWYVEPTTGKTRRYQVPKRPNTPG